MYTDQQIRTAMDGLIHQAGGDHRARPMFMNETGQAECFLGALAKFMGHKIPEAGTNAKYVLGEGAVSPRMEKAFAIAMGLNDNRVEWKYVVKAVDLVLNATEEQIKSKNKAGCPCGCTVGMDFQWVMDEVVKMRALDGAAKPKGPLHYATGGIITGSTGGIGGKITISFNSLSSAMNTITASSSMFEKELIAAMAVPAKKDHALVA